MSGPDSRDDLNDRVEAVRRSLRDRRGVFEPDTYFADRVIARLPRPEAWMITWAARRVLPVTLGLAVVLTIAVAATRGSARGSGSSASASATSQRGNDPLDWLLESSQELR